MMMAITSSKFLITFCVKVETHVLFTTRMTTIALSKEDICQKLAKIWKSAFFIGRKTGIIEQYKDQK
jgi:hypothetical protein